LRAAHIRAVPQHCRNDKKRKIIAKIISEQQKQITDRKQRVAENVSQIRISEKLSEFKAHF
jgi:hypothetical protein